LKKEAQVIGIGQAREGAGGLRYGKKVIAAGVGQLFDDIADALDALHFDLLMITNGVRHEFTSFNYSQKYSTSFLNHCQPVLFGENTRWDGAGCQPQQWVQESKQRLDTQERQQQLCSIKRIAQQGYREMRL